MTSISFTSGEVLDIIKALQVQADISCENDDLHLSSYYSNMSDQFQLIYDKLKDFQPENRVANLVLAVN